MGLIILAMTNGTPASRNELMQKIRAMKRGDQFKVGTNTERVTALQEGSALFRSGLVDFKVFSKKADDGFLIVAPQ